MYIGGFFEGAKKKQGMSVFEDFYFFYFYEVNFMC